MWQTIYGEFAAIATMGFKEDGRTEVSFLRGPLSLKRSTKRYVSGQNTPAKYRRDLMSPAERYLRSACSLECEGGRCRWNGEVVGVSEMRGCRLTGKIGFVKIGIIWLIWE